jgi:hypothetical protein
MRSPGSRQLAWQWMKGAASRLPNVAVPASNSISPVGRIFAL